MFASGEKEGRRVTEFVRFAATTVGFRRTRATKRRNVSRARSGYGIGIGIGTSLATYLPIHEK